MQDKMTNEAITEVVHLALVDDEGTPRPLGATFEYDPADPYAITIRLLDGPATVCWTFARELLIDGFFEPTGDGDVHVFPCLSTECGAVVIVDLEVPSGGALLQIESRVVAEFVERMLASVPRGAESDLLDLDAALLELLESS